MVHHNAARFVSNIYHKKGDYQHFSISKVLNDLNWDTIEERRNQTRLIMAYKIVNGHVILDSEMLPKTQYQRPTTKGNIVRISKQTNL